jgi:hypothetical protein
MGFRPCPQCREWLFAAEKAAFMRDGRARLEWSCDHCDHHFVTLTDSAPVCAAAA